MVNPDPEKLREKLFPIVVAPPNVVSSKPTVDVFLDDTNFRVGSYSTTKIIGEKE